MAGTERVIPPRVTVKREKLPDPHSGRFVRRANHLRRRSRGGAKPVLDLP